MKVITVILVGASVSFSCSKNDFAAGSAPVKKQEASLGDDPDDDDPIVPEGGGETPPPVLPHDSDITPGDGGSVNTNCQFKAPNSGITKNGFVVFLNDSFKPGIFGTPSAVEGMAWVNGGTDKGYGTAPSTIDWNLCPKLAFHERGHSVTRTINFSVPAKDGEYELIIHRIRNDNENDGRGIWYHWDRRVSWKAGPLHYFVALKNYNVKCSYTAATDKFLCEHTSSTLTAIDCAARRGSTRKGLACEPMLMGP